MGLFSSKKPEESINRDRVRNIVKAGMKETDAADRSVSSAEFRRAKAAYEKAVHTATPAERRAAHTALRRHGY